MLALSSAALVVFMTKATIILRCVHQGFVPLTAPDATKLKGVQECYGCYC